MSEDSVLQQVREAREAYARTHDFDVNAIIAHLREQDARGDWPVVRLAPRLPAETGTGPDPSPQRSQPAVMPPHPVGA